MTKKKLAGDTTAPATRRFWLRDGSYRDVPLRDVEGVDRNDPTQAADFRGLCEPDGSPVKCDWCGGRADDKGFVVGGFVRFYDHDWKSAIGACPRCIFGAFRHWQSQNDPRSSARLAWSDSMTGIPGLSDSTWTLLSLWAWPNDTYLEALDRIPGEVEFGQPLEEIGARIAAVHQEPRLRQPETEDTKPPEKASENASCEVEPSGEFL